MENQGSFNGSSHLFITLKRSTIGVPQRYRLVLRGLGLRKIRQTVKRPNTSQVRGIINKVRHLIEVQVP